MAKKMISLEISDELREALRVEAFKRNKTLSATMREILEEALGVAKIIKEESSNN